MAHANWRHFKGFIKQKREKTKTNKEADNILKYRINHSTLNRHPRSRILLKFGTFANLVNKKFYIIWSIAVRNIGCRLLKNITDQFY